MLIPVVDRRVELLSIVSRLAGCPEYNRLLYNRYTDKIEEHFNRYKKHEAVKYTRVLRRQCDFSHDAPMRIAICLDEEYNLTEAIETQLRETENYRKLGIQECEKLMSLLRAFASETHFSDFYDSCKSIYESSVREFIPILELLDSNWHQEFFGSSELSFFRVIIAPGNGVDHYGPSIINNGIRTSYAVMSITKTETTDSRYWEIPVFNKDMYLGILVHEITHSFANRVCDQTYENAKASINALFSQKKKGMRAQAYGFPLALLYEYLTRAVTIVYMKTHGESEAAINNRCLSEKSMGFIYINELIAELENYAAKRDIYPTMDSFVPVLAKTFDNLAATGARHAAGMALHVTGPAEK